MSKSSVIISITFLLLVTFLCATSVSAIAFYFLVLAALTTVVELANPAQFLVTGAWLYSVKVRKFIIILQFMFFIAGAIATYMGI